MTFENKFMTRFGFVLFIVFNAIFNHISVISYVAVSFIHGGNRSTRRKHVASHLQTLSHNVVSSTPRHEWGSNSQR